MASVISDELLLIHGGADGGVPLAASAHRIQKLIPDARLTVYDGGGHGEYLRPGLKGYFAYKSSACLVTFGKTAGRYFSLCSPTRHLILRLLVSLVHILDRLCCLTISEDVPQA